MNFLLLQPDGVELGEKVGKSGAAGVQKKEGRSEQPKATAATIKKRRRPTSADKRKRTKKKQPKEAVCDSQMPVFLHTVQEGEHIGLIAGRYGVFRKDVIELNPALNDPDLIFPGQKLKVCPEIPPRELIVEQYVVQKGDSWSRIAKAQKLSLADLVEMQGSPVDLRRSLAIGTKIRIVREGEILPAFDPTQKKSTPGRLRSSYKLPEKSFYQLRRPFRAYGTKRTVELLSHALDDYRRRAKGGPKVTVGDMSKKGGGPLHGHLSHRRGIDVDIGLVHRGAAARRSFITATKTNLDTHRTWLLVHSFLRTGQIRFIFLDYAIQKELYEHAIKIGIPKTQLDVYFQYPRGPRRQHGIVRHWKGHKNHIHVRFRGEKRNR